MPAASSAIATTLPAAYGDGSFDVLLRSADSVVVYWDLPPVESTDRSEDARLCLRLQLGRPDPRTARAEILDGLCGYRILSVEGATEELSIELGWMDPRGHFQRVGERTVQLPAPLPAAS